MSNNLVLFYSNKCIHSKEFLNMLYKDNNLNNQTTKVNVDNPNIKLPPYIKSVPSLIINENNKPNLLVGSKIFDWYNQKHKQNISNDTIMEWDPCTMSGYSDAFSYLENEDVNKIQTYRTNERIRDIEFDKENNVYYLLGENTPSLIILTTSN